MDWDAAFFRLAFAFWAMPVMYWGDDSIAAGHIATLASMFHRISG